MKFNATRYFKGKSSVEQPAVDSHPELVCA